MANGTTIGLEAEPGTIARSGPALIALLGALALVVLYFARSKVHFFVDFSEPSYSPYFWPRRFGLLLHISGGAVAISTGLVQLWLGLSGRTSALHRRLGRLYVTGVAVGIIGGTYLAATIPDRLAYSSGLLGLNLAWLATTGMGYLAIRRGAVSQHRAWMLRSYTVTFAFVFFRLAADTLSGRVAVVPELETMLAWGCWAVPLLVAEVLIQLPAVRQAPA
jgi:uncharacterized membrane protein YozB (DUF420 family)